MKMCDCIQGRLPCTSKPAEQPQGEPIGEVVAFGKGLHEIAWSQGKMPRLGAKLYTHPDSGEVERMRKDRDDLQSYADELNAERCDWERKVDTLRAQLAERDALLSTAAAMLKECIDTGELDTDEQWRAEQIVAKIGGTEPSAPVERDERADFESDWAERHGIVTDVGARNSFYRLQPLGRYRWPDVQNGWDAWQARANLERKS